MEKGIFKLTLIQTIKGWKECATVITKYGSNWRFLFPWLWLKASYLLHDAYAVSRRYHKRIGCSDIYLYGETPLTTLRNVALKAHIINKDHVFELGSGSGFTCLWLNTFLGCQVTAVEQVPVFCWRLQKVAQRFRLTGIKVVCSNYLLVSLDGATVIYLYASNLDDITITHLTSKFMELRLGVKIITVSYPLQPYCTESNGSKKFHILDKFSASFEWGEADVYLQVLTDEDYLSDADCQGKQCRIV